MRARVFDPVREAPERAFGSILAADVHGSGDHATLRKGMRFSDADRSTLAALPGPVHLVDLEPDELEQDAVARRLALAAVGPGTRADEPAQGQARIRAAARGLLRVRADAVEAVNRLHPLQLFTAGDGAVVAEGDDVAGAKSASLATREQLVAEAEHLARRAPVITVLPFARRRVAVLVTDRFEASGRAKVRESIQRKLEWFGSALVSFAEVAYTPDAVTVALRDALTAGADLVLCSGASPLDPLDPVFVALERSGGRVLRTGVPAHPGSMVWVGALPAAPVLGVATCSGFGKDTALDLLLARVLAGDAPSDAADALGARGLAEGPLPGSPFPPYERRAKG